MSLEATLNALEAANTRLTEEVVLVKDVSSQSMNGAIAARDRAEQAATATESTRELMFQKFNDFSEIDEAVIESREMADATAADRVHIDQQVNHVDNQRTHIDNQRSHIDNEREHVDSQRAHIDSQRAIVDTKTNQVRDDATQVAEDRVVVASDRNRAETARLSAEALYVDLEAINSAKLATKASEEAAAGSALGAANARTHVDEQVVHVDSQVEHVDAERAHIDNQRAHIDTQRSEVDLKAIEVATNTDTVATNMATTKSHRNAAQAAQAASETARDESREWATGEGVVAAIDGKDRYSARAEADRALAEAGNARDEANRALDERQTAQQAAINAGNSATAAKASENAAAGSESHADAHRIEAMKWASADENIEIAPGLYSAKHYMIKTRTLATGTLIYIGAWDASTGVFPSEFSPATGHFYKVSVAGVVEGEEFLVGDQIIFNGTTWDHIDNTERVTSVGGFIGDITDSQLLTAIKRVDGASSGLDADLLDGKHASAFVTTHSPTFESGYFEIKPYNASYDDGSKLQSFYDGNSRKLILQVRDSANATSGLDLAINGNNVWHSGNQGASSGLDADLLDGKHASAFATSTHLHDDRYYQKSEFVSATDSGNTPVMRDSSGDIRARLIRQSYATTNSTVNFIMTQVNQDDNNYLRPSTPAQVKAALGLDTLSQSASGLGITLGGRTGHIGSRNSTWLHYESSTGAHYFYGAITCQGNITAYSDERVKANLKVIDDALNKVCAISGYTFDRTDIECPRQAGVIAQQILRVLPEAVTKDAETGHYHVAYGNLIGLLIEAIKDERAARELLAARLTKLEFQRA